MRTVHARTRTVKPTPKTTQHTPGPALTWAAAEQIRADMGPVHAALYDMAAGFLKAKGNDPITVEMIGHQPLVAFIRADRVMRRIERLFNAKVRP